MNDKIENIIIIVIVISSNFGALIFFNIHAPDTYKINDCKDVSNFLGDNIKEKEMSCNFHNTTIQLAQSLVFSYFITGIYISVISLMLFFLVWRRLIVNRGQKAQ